MLEGELRARSHLKMDGSTCFSCWMEPRRLQSPAYDPIIALPPVQPVDAREGAVVADPSDRSRADHLVNAPILARLLAGVVPDQRMMNNRTPPQGDGRVLLPIAGRPGPGMAHRDVGRRPHGIFATSSCVAAASRRPLVCQSAAIVRPEIQKPPDVGCVLHILPEWQGTAGP